MKNETINILLVEDSEADCELTKRVMQRECKRAYHLVVLTNGKKALDYLQQSSEQKTIGLPDIILLDLNLPIIDGWEVLEKIKTNPIYKVIPVIVITTSQSMRDVMKAYQLGANSYIAKPLDIDRFTRVIGLIDDYWFSMVELPDPNDNQ